MLYGSSKFIAQYIDTGNIYADVKKVYFVTIAYFDLGHGEDYVYYGKTEFHGIHRKDKLLLSEQQVKLLNKSHVHEIFPEYWVIKADRFDDRIKNALDEWIYFLKNSKLPDSYTAPGLRQAGEKLSELSLSGSERGRYDSFLKFLRYIASEKFTQEADMRMEREEGKEEGRAEGIENTAVGLLKSEVSEDVIMKSTGLIAEQLQ